MPDSHGLITFPRSENAGDAIQSLAALRFLPRADVLLDRESLDVASGAAPGSIKVIGNGWYAHDPDRWPPAPEIDLLPISMHFSPRALDGFFSETNREWWTSRPHPVGARDLFTLEGVRARGVEAYFSGCLTLTLTAKTAGLASGRIILCDVSDTVRRHVERKSALPVDVVSHAQSSRTEITTKLAEAERLLATYAGAAAVITTRIHAALPCLALGTPVFLIDDVEDNYRFSGLTDFLNFGSEAELLSGVGIFSLNGETENPTRHLDVRRELTRTVQRFLDPSPTKSSKKTAMTKPVTAGTASGAEADFGRSKDGDPGAAHHVPVVSSDAVTSPDSVLLAEIARLRAEQAGRDRELDAARARLAADGDRLLSVSTEVARLQARFEVLQEAQAERSQKLAELEALRPALLDAEHRVRVKDDYIGTLEKAQAATLERVEQKDAYIAELEAARGQAAAADEGRIAESVALSRELEIKAAQAEAEHAEALRARDLRLAEAVALSHELEVKAAQADAAHAEALKDRDLRLAEAESRLKHQDLRIAEVIALSREQELKAAQMEAEHAEQLQVRERGRTQLAATLDERNALIERLEREIAALAARDGATGSNRPALERLAALIDHLEDRDAAFDALERSIVSLADAHDAPAGDDPVARLAGLLAVLGEAPVRLQAVEDALRRLRMKTAGALAENLSLRDNVWRKDVRLAELTTLLDEARSDGEARLSELQAETEAMTGALEADLRRLRMQHSGATAENLTLRDNAWRKDNVIAEIRRQKDELQNAYDTLPWRVIAIYRKARRAVPKPVLHAVARMIPRRQG